MKTIKYTKGKFLLLPIGRKPKAFQFVEDGKFNSRKKKKAQEEWKNKFNNNEGAVELNDYDSVKIRRWFKEKYNRVEFDNDNIEVEILFKDGDYIHIPSEKVEIKNGKGYLK